MAQDSLGWAEQWAPIDGDLKNGVQMTLCDLPFHPHYVVLFSPPDSKCSNAG